MLIRKQYKSVYDYKNLPKKHLKKPIFLVTEEHSILTKKSD